MSPGARVAAVPAPPAPTPTRGRPARNGPKSVALRAGATTFTAVFLLNLLLVACPLIVPVNCGDDEARVDFPLALALVAGTGAGAGAGERPKLIPLVAADSGYSENSSVNILCTVSQGHHESLAFDWFKDGHLLPLDKIDEFALAQPQIEKHQDHSLLRIARVQAQHSGRYTCSARNQFGQDSSSVNLIVNVKLQWTKEPPKEIVVSLNQELKVDCLAQGEPKPLMRWEKLEASLSSLQSRAGNSLSSAMKSLQLAQTNSNGYKLAQATVGSPQPIQQQQQQQSGIVVSSGRYLSIQRAREQDSGVYECIASNARDADLRKLVHVQVRGE